jgi:superfamily II DNA or RNA helicase
MNIIDEEHIPTNQTENQIKGTAYERQILDLIRREKPAYLWHQTPETILIENGIIGSHNVARLKRKEVRTNPDEYQTENPLRDTGIDIIQMETETECALVQCKNGYKRGVSMHDLSGFMCWMAMMPDKHGYVYYTDKLSTNIRTLPIQNRIQYLQVPSDISYLPSAQPIQVASQPVPAATPLNQTSIFTPDPEKLEYQTKARDLAVEYYRDQDNGVLAMPCGTGKTYTAFLIAQNFKYIIILSPLREFAKQNLDRFVEYGFPRANTLLVDSDGCRDVARIREFITTHTETGLLMSATYDSADVISSVLDAFTNPPQTLIIGDEFHNLSAANVNDESDPMNKILVADGFKKLFMSATPRVFELESGGETGDYVLGDTIYDMSFKYAIDRGFITDYRIWLPSIHEDISDLRADIANELDLKAVLGSENIIYIKAIYLFSCLVNTGSQKCIIYCVDTNEIRDLMETMTRLNDYYCLDLHMDKITAANSASSRTQILSAFASGQQIELLFSVRILDECIDIPSCDSIYITYPTKSKIRTIQRLMRCTRTLRSNKHKVGQVFIWCSEYDSILETLGGIKEIDSSFAEKVMINEVGQFRERGTSSARTAIKDDSDAVKKLIIGVKEYRMVSWFEKLELLKQYIDTNKKRPSDKSKDPKIKTLGLWC